MLAYYHPYFFKLMLMPHSFVINLVKYDTFLSDPQYHTLNPLAHKFKSKLGKTRQLPNCPKTLPFPAACKNIGKFKAGC